MTLNDHLANDSTGLALPSLHTAKDVAAALNISVKTVHRLVREGKLPCVQVTVRERRFTPKQVQQYIESQSTRMRVDKKTAPAVSSRPRKGGAKSIGVSGTDLRKEMRSW
jgi:excisionase family DNA binding protein